VGVRGARAERHHRASPSRQRLGSVPLVVPTEDADAGDVRACYRATTTYPGPRQGTAGRDVPGAPRPDRRHNLKLRYYKRNTFIHMTFIKTCISNFVRSTTHRLRSRGSHRRDRAVPRLGATGAPQHVREDPRCGHEVFGRRELRRGRRDSSPSAPPGVVLELRLHCDFAVDACYLCQRVLGSEGTTPPTGAGPAGLRAAAICSTRRRYFQ
jgi:hypothetical protein